VLILRVKNVINVMSKKKRVAMPENAINAMPKKKPVKQLNNSRENVTNVMSEKRNQAVAGLPGRGY